MRKNNIHPLFILIIIASILSFFANCNNSTFSQKEKSIRIIKTSFRGANKQLTTRIYDSNTAGTTFSERLIKYGKSPEQRTNRIFVKKNKVIIKTFNKENKLQGYTVNSYNPISKLIFQKKRFNSQKKLIYKISFRYDKENNLISKIKFDASEKKDGYSFYFNSLGNLTKDIYFQHGKKIKYTLHFYDKKNKLIKRELYNNKEQITKTKLFVYNKNNLLIKREELDKKLHLISKIETSYNKNNYRSSVRLYELNRASNKIFLKIVRNFYYNDKNSLIQIKTLNQKGKIISSSKYEYDKLGNKIKQSSFNSRGKLEGFSLFSYE